MSPGTISPLSGIKALTFDIFGTVVDWRTSVVEELTLRAHRKSSSSTVSTTLKTQLGKLTEEDWGRFAQAWRDSYGKFTRSFDPEKDEWKTVDQHHYDSLVQLLAEWQLEGLYSEFELESLSLVWHRLAPWPDSPTGIQALSRNYTLATLSNGNASLLRDLIDFSPSPLPFHHIYSAETFKAYKPNPDVYRGAAREMGLEMGEVAMVAAHLGDLEAARGLGMRTIYVEREREEAWDKEKAEKAREWVDVWVSLGHGGMDGVEKELARYR